MRTFDPTVLASIVLVLFTPGAGGARAQSPGQTSAEPRTVAECLQAAQSHTGKRLQDLRAAGQTIDYAQLRQEAIDLARQCGARFEVGTVATGDLTTLARLYAAAQQPALAQRAINRYVATPGLADRDKADALVVGVDVSLSGQVTEDRARQAEAYAADLDALKGVERQRVKVHLDLGDHFRGVDVDDRILAHADRVIELARRLPPADRQAMLSSIAGAYANAAEVHAGREHAGQAIAVLEQGLKELGSTPEVRQQIDPRLERYRLVGGTGASIEAPHWLNAPAGTTKVDVTGKVSLVEFTSHWCGPCRKSYPAILRLHNAWARKGLQVLFATQLFGFFEEQRSFTAEQEIEADRKYYVEQYGLPFEIAIEDQPSSAQPGTSGSPPVTANFARYKVTGIPQIVVIDRRGRIRLIVVGWDAAAEARLDNLVQRLLAEPTT